MPDLLVPGPLSLTECINIVRVQSRDENAVPVWNDDDIKLAIRQAVLNSQGKFFTSHSTTLAYLIGVYEYTIADVIQRIILVTRERAGLESTPNTLNTNTPDQDITSFRHVNLGKGQNTLVFYRDYLTATMTIYYERDVPVPIDERVLSANIDSAATSATLTNATPQLWRLTLPFYFKIDEEIVKVTAAASNTAITIARAQLGTYAVNHTAGAALSQMVFADSDRFYTFLFSEVGRLLNMWRVQAGSGQLDVSANVTAQRLFRDDRDEIAANRAQPRRTKKIKFAKDRRPRRGI